MTRLAVFATHPIQYQAPIWRRLASEPGIDLTVHYFSDGSLRGGVDTGFGVNVAWDVPLLDGYRSEFLSRTSDLERPLRVTMKQPQRLFRAGAFDAVLIQGYTHGFELQTVMEARRSRVPVIMRGELSDIRFKKRSIATKMIRTAFLRLLYRNVSAFCYIGAESRRHLERLGVPPSKLFFSPYCVDTGFFEAHRAAGRLKARASLGIPEGALVVLFAGKLIPRKDPLLFCEALRQLSDVTSVFAIVLGDGELRSRVEEKLRAALGDRALLPGFVNQTGLPLYYVAADVFVLPSRAETWGLVVNEAMTFGLPVIVAKNVGCCEDLVVEGKTGFVIAGGDAAGLAGKIQYFLLNRTEIQRMGVQAQRLVADYSASNAVKGIVGAVRSSQQGSRWS